MSLHITERVVDGVCLLALSGRIVLGEESNALREKLKSLAAGGTTKIVLNMSDIDYIDSSGTRHLGSRPSQLQNRWSLRAPLQSRP